MAFQRLSKHVSQCPPLGSGIFTSDPDFTSSLNMLFRQRLPADNEIKAIVKAFTLIAFDVLNTIEYLTSDGDGSVDEAESVFDQPVASDDKGVTVSKGHRVEASARETELLPVQFFVYCPIEDDNADADLDDDGLADEDQCEDNVPWAMQICEERFQQYLASTNGAVRNCLGGVNFEETWIFFMQKVIGPAILDYCAECKMFLAFDLCEWMYDAATHFGTNGHRQVSEVLGTMRDFQTVLRSEPIPHLELEMCPNRLQLGDWDDGGIDEYELNYEEYTTTYEKVDIAFFVHGVLAKAMEHDCIICQDNDGSPWVALEVCEHAFPENCLSAWADYKAKVFTCPLCRLKICERPKVEKVVEDWKRAYWP